MHDRTLAERTLSTPLGTMVAGATDEALCRLEFIGKRKEDNPLEHQEDIFALQEKTIPGSNPILDKIEEELAGYFAGKLRKFSVALDLQGTPFQQSVWNELLKIPYGETWSYADLARRLGDLKTIRAAASANGQNPIAIVVPCHRVIGSNGSLTGYAGGLWRKKELLLLEGATAPAPAGQEQLSF